MDNTTVPAVPLDALDEIAGKLAFADDSAITVEELKIMGTQVAWIAQHLRENYTALKTTGRVPTVAQGVALARFIRPSLEHKGIAHVCAGGAGLPSDYLYVRLEEPGRPVYEGGIAPNGSTST